MNIGDRTAVVVAHPDDETLWAGGLLARYNNWDIVCCSIPRRDPERINDFKDAVKFLNHNPVIYETTEPSASVQMSHLYNVDLSNYDCIFTHNIKGEYGHVHHKQIHKFVMANTSCKVYSFGFGKGKIVINLTQDEIKLKSLALQCYQNKSPADKGLPKWKALLNRYNIDMYKETFNEER